MARDINVRSADALRSPIPRGNSDIAQNAMETMNTVRSIFSHTSMSSDLKKKEKNMIYVCDHCRVSKKHTKPVIMEENDGNR